MNEPQLVTPADVHHQLLYFTSTSLLSDHELVTIGTVNGQPNLHYLNLKTGTQCALTQHSEGVLRSYVYFDGQPFKGFGKASVALDTARRRVFYIHGREIRVVSMDGSQRVLAVLPDDQVTAFTHVSADGSRLCVPTTDARAFEGGKMTGPGLDFDIDARVQAENLYSTLHVFDTETGAVLQRERVAKAWITHVQFSPVNNDLILYNHEWPSDCGIRRVWLFDGKRHIRLRTEEGGRSRHDWACHEMWTRDGAYVLYHGAFADKVNFLGRVRPDGSERIEIPLPTTWTQYGHFTAGNGDVLVSDGYYCEPGDDMRLSHGLWVAALDINWPERQIAWRALCRNSSSWATQDEHPHPVYDHAGRFVYFTSDRHGKRGVYRIAAA